MGPSPQAARTTVAASAAFRCTLGVRLRVYYTADNATSTVWLLHGYDIAADPARERAARETAETEVARRVLASWEQQRRAR
jgi:hypothetical protein